MSIHFMMDIKITIVSLAENHLLKLENCIDTFAEFIKASVKSGHVNIATKLTHEIKILKVI